MINFKCTNCGNDQLEEVMTGVTVTSPILTILDGDDLGDCVYDSSMDVPRTLNDGGEIDRFQCIECGEVVDDGTTPTTLTELVEVLQKREENAN